MEENKVETPALITPALMEIKINTEITKNKLSIADLEKRALEVVKNEDNLLAMDAILKDLVQLENVATETHKTTKKPFLDAVDNCDAGKKLVFEHTKRIRDMIKPDYDRILGEIDTRKRAATKKEAEDKAIRKGIEEIAIAFSKKIIAAGTSQALSNVERLINLEKSPSRVKKYGDFHALAMKRYDEVLIPIIKNQKLHLSQLTALHGELEEAVSDSETEDVERLKGRIGEVTKGVRHNQAVAEANLINQDFFPVVEAEEVLPDIRTKRTDISYELVDAALAFKKTPELLVIELNKKELKKIAADMKAKGLFEGKDFLIVNGIKFVVTRLREAL